MFFISLNKINNYFDEVFENDNNKIMCIKNYIHNTYSYHSEGYYYYYLYEIDWENNSCLLSSNYHDRIRTKLSIIKEHFDLRHIIRKRKIEKLLIKN